jgi:ABC-2 type transport system ATP-binding protein
VAENQESAAALLSQDPNVQEVEPQQRPPGSSLRDGITDFTFIPQRLMAAGYRLTLLKEEEVNLETAFMRLTKGMVQ